MNTPANLTLKHWLLTFLKDGRWGMSEAEMQCLRKAKLVSYSHKSWSLTKDGRKAVGLE